MFRTIEVRRKDAECTNHAMRHYAVSETRPITRENKVFQDVSTAPISIQVFGND